MTEPSYPTHAPRRILVPVDLGVTASTVTEFAHAFAASVNAELTLLHVWEPPPFSPPESLYVVAGEGHRTLAQHVKMEAVEHLSQLLPSTPRITDRKAVIGEPSSCILAEAERGGYDLIIVGTHGRTGLSHLTLGSVAEKVLRRSPIPVLVVPCGGRKEITA